MQHHNSGPTPPPSMSVNNGSAMMSPVGGGNVGGSGYSSIGGSSQKRIAAGSGSQQHPDSNEVLDKKRLQELVKEVDPNEQLDEEVETMLLQIADDFIEQVFHFNQSFGFSFHSFWN
jgi:transcription initiation factor TFIID subunit 12